MSVLDTARRITLAVIQSVVLGSRETSFAGELARLVDTFASPLANFALFAPALARRSRWNVLAERFHRQRDRADALLADQVAAVRADRRVDAREDVLALLARACDDNGRGLTDDELNDELKALLIAGHETTATAIGWAADLLAHRPQAAEHLRHADRAHLAASGKEILRLRTVAPIAASRTLLEPTPTSDRVLPAGAAVVVDAYTLHRDPELFSDPESFRPDRFLDRGEALPAYAYLPFGGGAHRCLGAALATLELETAVQAIVERFELEPVGPPERPRRRGPTLIPGNGATVRVRRRGG